MEGKIILEFDGIEQQKEAKMAIDGSKWFWAFNSIFETIKRKEKNAEKVVLFSSDEIYTILNEARDTYNLPFEY